MIAARQPKQTNFPVPGFFPRRKYLRDTLSLPPQTAKGLSIYADVYAILLANQRQRKKKEEFYQMKVGWKGRSSCARAMKSVTSGKSFPRIFFSESGKNACIDIRRRRLKRRQRRRHGIMKHNIDSAGSCHIINFHFFATWFVLGIFNALQKNEKKTDKSIKLTSLFSYFWIWYGMFLNFVWSLSEKSIEKKVLF